MREYHKIQTCFKRDHNTNRIIEGDWSMPEFELLKDCQWVFTEKVDGTNIRVMWDGVKVSFGGKTDDSSMPVFLMRKLQEVFESKVGLLSMIFPLVQGDEEAYVPLEVCLYGEGYGAKIQKGGGNYNPKGVDFVLFDVKIGDWWLKREDVEDVATQLGIRVVPIIGQGTLAEAIEMTRKGIKSQWGDFTAEGIVARPLVELKTRRGDRIITKIKHRDFYGGDSVR